MMTTCLTANQTPAKPAAATRRVRVMIVDDSPVIRTLLASVIGRDPRLEIVGAADSGEEALSELETAAPDVISMDIRLPGINGFEATRRIMMRRPTPIVVVAADAEGPGSRIPIDALQAGALTVIEKPGGGSPQRFERFAERLCTQLVIMSQVQVVTQRSESRLLRAPTRDAPLSPVSAPCEMIGMVASTGGPNALAAVLGQLPADLRVPILLVQHMTSSFTRAFTDWLADVTPHLRVVEAADGERARPGHVHVAPAERHLALRGRQMRLETGPHVSSQRPSGSVLFASMAESLGASAVGVLLTGMGDDGAAGLLKLREAGGHTIAEHESTAVVYGMPGAAVAMRAVVECLPQPLIAPRLRQLAQR